VPPQALSASGDRSIIDGSDVTGKKHVRAERQDGDHNGWASGIGLGIAKALAGAGMNPVLADLRAGPLETARREIEALGTRAVGIGMSVLCPGAVSTHIFESAATRPERFGGPYARPQQEAMRGAMGQSLAPEGVGQRVPQAIQQREFYLLTHAGERAAIKARHDRIEAAFDRAEVWEKSR
jgi:short-subunit dehydrogenase